MLNLLLILSPINCITKTKNSIIKVAIIVIILLFLWKPSIKARFPNPPAPIIPAVAVKPIMVIIIVVREDIKRGAFSGINNLKIIW